ncbi:GerMN domain-containing protein [Thomasclavelia sp.]
MKKKLLTGILVCASLVICFICIKQNNNKKDTKQPQVKTNYQTVVFRDDNDTLIPIEVDLGQELEDDAKYRNMMEVMKSKDYEYLGLHPILDSNLQVNAMAINDKSLTFDFSDNLYVNNNQEALDIFEMLSYVFCVGEIEKVNIKIDGNDISELPNSTVPVSCITNRLGINNFESSTNYLYKTTPVVVYNTQTINNQEYYVPVTKRVETTDSDIDTKVSIMLKQMEYEQPLSLVQQCSLSEGTLQIHLASNILNDNESIDNTLYNRIVKSASHLEDVEKVSLFIDDQEIAPVEDVNGEVDNRIKI